MSRLDFPQGKLFLNDRLYLGLQGRLRYRSSGKRSLGGLNLVPTSGMEPEDARTMATSSALRLVLDAIVTFRLSLVAFPQHPSPPHVLHLDV